MTVQDVLSQTPYKDELENLNSKAIDFNNSVKEINKAKGGEEKDNKIREAKSAHAAYQYQSGIVHDLANRLANGKDLDHNVAHRASQEYNKAAYAADASVQKTIENQNLILQEDVSADYLEIKNPIEGVYHYSNEGVCSWYDFTKMIAEYSGQTQCNIIPCHSEEFPSKVKRPAYSVLDKTKVKETFGLMIPYWTDSLKYCLKSML